MRRRTAALSAAAMAITFAAADVVLPGIAHGGPEPCTYQLSAPELSQAPGGVPAIGADLQLMHCEDPWQPVSSEVCLTPAVGHGECSIAFGWNIARVYLVPTQESRDYTATGRSCARAFGVPNVCVANGPIRASF